MSDLLAADFTRLVKSQVFKGVIIFCIESLLFEVIAAHLNNNLNLIYLEALLNTNFLVFGILLSVFIGLFIGSEYSDGTIRNKLVAGNSRTAIYLSNLITCILGGFIMQVINFIELNIISIVIYKLPIPLTLKTVEKQVVALYIIVAYTAIFLLVTTLICSKSGGTAAVMALALLILTAGMTINGQLSSYDPKEAKAAEEAAAQSETQDPAYQYEVVGGFFVRQKKPLSGFKLKTFLFLDDFLPASQSQKLTSLRVPKNVSKYVLYDFSTAGLTTVLGIILFKNKDLK